VLDHLVEADVLVVLALLCLRRRREDRFRQAITLAKAARQPDSADGAAFLVLLPARAGEIPADDGFDRKDLGGPADHDPPSDRVELCKIGRLVPRPPEIGRVCARQDREVSVEEMVWNDPCRFREPEPRQACKNASLVRNHCRENYVERRDAVGCDHQEPAIVERREVSDLPRSQERLSEHGPPPPVRRGGR